MKNRLEMLGYRLTVAWLISAFVIPFFIGALVVVTPFISLISDWAKNVTLYDILRTAGLYYALYMTLVGLFWAADKGRLPERFLLPLLAIVILILLIVGWYILPTS